MLTLEMAVDDAIHRIRNAYTQTDGKIYLSFSGGKDSTIVAKLIEMANLPHEIDFVFANTGVELDATLSFVSEYKWTSKKTVRPTKPLPKVLAQYGLPVCSKAKSKFLYIWGNQVRNDKNPLEKVACTRLLGSTGNGNDKLSSKHLHLLHPAHEYKISNRCCHYLKKRPFDLYERESGNLNVIMGIRTAEGGVRSSQYNSCFLERKKYGYVQKVSLPIIDWSNDLCDEFVAHYNIELSKAYTEYGFTRTGCLLCPYSHRTLAADAKILKEKEPLKYRAALAMFSRAYMDMNIELPFDEKYTQEFEATRAKRESRNIEMREKWERPPIK